MKRLHWKVSCSDLWQPKISGALLRENLRRFWTIPVLAFLFYFLSGPFLILMNYGHLQNSSHLVSNILHDYNVGFVLLHVLVPVVSAAAVFRYLQQPGVVITAHSLPLSRSTLFNTNLLSGFLMTALPLMGNALVLFVIRKPVYAEAPLDDAFLPFATAVEEHAYYPDGAYNLFSGGAVLQWLVLALLTVLFVYAITVLAGVLTGASLLHFGFGLWFNFLLPILWLCLLFYFDLFFFGFMDSGSVQNFPTYMHPLLRRLTESAASPLFAVFFLFVAALILLLAKWLYASRPMERVGDALVFRFMQPLLCYLIAFISMTLFGMYFKEVFNASRYGTALGIASGAVLGFVIGRMIVLKTLQIFNRRTAKSFAAFAVICALLMGSFAVDLFGYEKRVPENDGIAAVDFPMDSLFCNYPLTTGLDRDPQTIPYVTDIHREILSQRELIENSSVTRVYARFGYTLNNGWEACRAYRLPNEYLYRSQAMRAYYNSPVFRQSIEASFASIKDVTYVQVYSCPPSYEYRDDYAAASEEFQLYPNEYDLQGLVDAVKEDMLTMNYAQAIMEPLTLFELQIHYPSTAQDAVNKTRSQYIPVTAQMTHTIEWLTEQNLCSPLTDATSLIAGVLVTPETENGEDMVNLPETGDAAPASTVQEAASPRDGTPSQSDVRFWDGDTAYRYNMNKGYELDEDVMLPVSLARVRSQSPDSLLVTDPDDLLQLLLYMTRSEGVANGKTYRLTFLFKTDDMDFAQKFNNFYLSEGLLAMEECDFAVSPQLTDFMAKAFPDR